MSALGFQIVMAGLIRFPTEPYEKIAEMFGSESVTEKEEQQLRKMSLDPLVRKFGYKMSLCRRRDATEIMKLSKAFISEEILDEIFHKHFEPTRTSTDLVMLGVQFLELALKDPICQVLLSGCPSFTVDLMRYDLAKASVLRMVTSDMNTILPEGSLLATSLFQILTIDYDAPALDQLRVKDPTVFKIPEKKKLVLIFMRISPPPYYRMFQIDESIAQFLTTQREAPASWQKELPKPYAAMVKAGLCRELNSDLTSIIEGR